MAYQLHDQALAALQGIGPELGNGAPNHAPMVIEALAALGYGAEAAPWIERHRTMFAIEPVADTAPSGDPLALLGRDRNTAAWRMLFRRELAQSCWRNVLEQWLPWLLPGAMATGTHGVIRCGHAVRALKEQETDARLDELAGALAYCAGRYRKIFDEPSLSGGLDLADAVRTLPLLPAQLDRRGPPPKVIKALLAMPAFAESVSRLRPPAGPLQGLVALAETGARLYLHNASRHPLVMLHAVTGPAAVHLLVADQSPALRHLAFAYAWQAVATWAAAYGTHAFMATPEPMVIPWDQLTRAAVTCGDDHAIKFTEACRRMDEMQPSPAFRAAAADWMRRLGEARDWPAQKLVDTGIRTRAVPHDG